MRTGIKFVNFQEFDFLTSKVNIHGSDKRLVWVPNLVPKNSNTGSQPTSGHSFAKELKCVDPTSAWLLNEDGYIICEF